MARVYGSIRFALFGPRLSTREKAVTPKRLLVGSEEYSKQSTAAATERARRKAFVHYYYCAQGAGLEWPRPPLQPTGMQ